MAQIVNFFTLELAFSVAIVGLIARGHAFDCQTYRSGAALLLVMPVAMDFWLELTPENKVGY